MNRHFEKENSHSSQVCERVRDILSKKKTCKKKKSRYTNNMQEKNVKNLNREITKLHHEIMVLKILRMRLNGNVPMTTTERRKLSDVIQEIEQRWHVKLGKMIVKLTSEAKKNESNSTYQ